MKKIKVVAVSYLNTKPFLYGLFKSAVSELIDLQLAISSECARMLRDGEADLGLVPVAVIPELDAPRLVSHYCIGAERSVRTVAIFSEKPIEELDRIYLDYHSRTSVELAKILIRDYWQLQPELLPAYPGFEDRLDGTTGGLIIGDRAVTAETRYPLMYDLAEAWHAMSGLPFVFAAWVSNKPVDPAFLEVFDQALALGIDKVPELVYLLPDPHPGFDLRTYFTENISYALDEPKQEGLDLFLKKIGFSGALPVISPTIAPLR
ncbi:MAG TPA: menaquinone biosynthesis protein [Flavilitoribacter sp.]|nr:menaquinone biosynthesis protein [Flavilitoribacter sp.]